MADDNRGNGEKAAAAGAGSLGGGLIAFGGFGLFKDSHILENGEFSLVHNQFGGSGRVEVNDGGVGLNCDSRWIVHPFWTGSSSRVEAGPGNAGDPQPPDATHQPANTAEAPFPQLKARVSDIANDLRTLTETGDILVVGSTDPKPFHKGGATTNESLALARAQQVGDLLKDDLSSAHPLRHILVANDKMTFAEPLPPGVKAPPLNTTTDHLARALFGAKESSGRSVLICVMEQQPHGVVVSGAGGDGSGVGWVSAGVIGALSAAIVLACAGGVFGMLSWRWLIEQMKKDP
jgi:hypothetical protein